MRRAGSRQDAKHDADGRQAKPLPHDERGQPRRRRAERRTDADLARALGDAALDDAVNTDAGQQQRREPERREYRQRERSLRLGVRDEVGHRGDALERQRRIHGPNRLLDRLDERCRVARRLHDQRLHGVGPRPLAQRDVERVRRLRKRRLLHVADDADDRPPRPIRTVEGAYANALADRIAAGEAACRERLVDQNRLRRARPVVRAEQPSTHQGYAHRLEPLGRDAVTKRDARVLGAACRRLHEDAIHLEAATAERQQARQRGVVDAGHRANGLEHALEECQSLGVPINPCAPRHDDLHRQDA